jgi:hypothetical protein
MSPQQMLFMVHSHAMPFGEMGAKLQVKRQRYCVQRPKWLGFKRYAGLSAVRQAIRLKISPIATHFGLLLPR